MRKHVMPADAGASIPNPERGRPLPPEGETVGWTPYWAQLQARRDIVASDMPEIEGDPVTASDAPVSDALPDLDPAEPAASAD